MIPGIVAARRRSFPVGPSDPYWSDVVALLHFNGSDGSTTITDETGRVWTAHNAATIDTAASKFGGASLVVPSSSDWVDTPDDPLLSVDSGDLTIEAWVNPSTLGIHQHTISNKRTGSGQQEHTFVLDTSNKLTFACWSSTALAAVLVSTTVVPVGSFTHVAVTRSGITWRIFVNGNLEAQVDETVAPTREVSALNIGRDNFNYSRFFEGHIDEFRFTRVARYTASFTPPVTPFPNA